MPSPANPQSFNRYAYTLNNPLRYTDPTGHFDVPVGECGELCQLLGFSDWDTFNSWWSMLEPDGFWQSILTTARWGDMLSFTAFGEELNLMFVQLSSGATIQHRQPGIFGNASLGFWDNDAGVSLDFLTGQSLWFNREGGSASTSLGASGHPWNGRDAIEGSGEYVSFDETWNYGRRLLIRAQLASAVMTTGTLAGKVKLPEGSFKAKIFSAITTLGGWFTDVIAGADIWDIGKELTVEAEDWAQLGPAVVHKGNGTDFLTENPWLWQR